MQKSAAYRLGLADGMGFPKEAGFLRALGKMILGGGTGNIRKAVRKFQINTVNPKTGVRGVVRPPLKAGRIPIEEPGKGLALKGQPGVTLKGMLEQEAQREAAAGKRTLGTAAAAAVPVGVMGYIAGRGGSAAQQAAAQMPPPSMYPDMYPPMYQEPPYYTGIQAV